MKNTEETNVNKKLLIIKTISPALIDDEVEVVTIVGESQPV